MPSLSYKETYIALERSSTNTYTLIENINVNTFEEDKWILIVIVESLDLVFDDLMQNSFYFTPFVH